MKLSLLLIAVTTLSISGGVEAKSLKDFGKDILNQATRKSSCTYLLTIKGVTSNKSQAVKRKAVTKEEACALAKSACHEIGNDKGFFGKHTCSKENADSGGIITRKIEGETGHQDSNNRSGKIRELRRINSQLKLELEKLENVIVDLKLQLGSKTPTELEVENKKLRKRISNLKSKLANKNEKISTLTTDLSLLSSDYEDQAIVISRLRNELNSRPSDGELLNKIHKLQQKLDSKNSKVISLSNEVSRLNKKIRLITGDDDVSKKPRLTPAQLDACDYATTTSGLASCLTLAKKYELSVEVIGACDYATTSKGLNLCLEAAGQINAPQMEVIISKCDYATSRVKDLVDCMDYYR